MLEQISSALASTERIIPPTLRIVTPPKYEHREVSATYLIGRQHILLRTSQQLASDSQPASCMADNGNKSWQLPSPMWRRRKGSLQDETGEGSEGHFEPPSPSPTSSPSSPLSWQIRRVVSASSAASPLSPSDISPISSSSKMNRRPSRLSSFIRRHHSAGIEAIQEPVAPLLKPPQRSYIPYSQSYQPPRSAPPQNGSFPGQISTSMGPSRQAHHPPPATAIPSFSPIGRNPYEPWSVQHRPRTAVSSPIAYQMERPFTNPAPTRGFSNSSAPASSSAPLPRILDTTAKLDAEPEGFTSPSEFALFAEATSSLSILSPISDEPSPSRSPNLQPQRHNLTLPAASTALLAPSPMFSAPRAQSVPPSASNQSHERSSSGSFPHPYSHIPAPPHQPRAPLRQMPSRTQLIAEALTGVGDDGSGDGSDDELPDYATSQAEASAQQRQEAARRARELEDSWRRGRVERSRWA